MKDTELRRTIELAKNGDRQAFEMLYTENYDRLYYYVLKNVGKREAAEDITQETFLQSMEKIGSLKNPENYLSWLHSIAYHKCTDLYRSESRFDYYENDEEIERAAEITGLEEPVMLPEDYSVDRDRKRRLGEIIDGLKPDMKSAIILYYYDNLSVSEVARSMGINENTAKQKLFQARKKLKTEIKKLCGKGVVLSAVPIGSMLHETVTPGYANAARKSAGAVISGGAVAAKAVAVTAAAAVVIGVPIGLGKLGKDKNTYDREILHDSSVVTESRLESSISENEQTDDDSEHKADNSVPDTDSMMDEVLLPEDNSGGDSSPDPNGENDKPEEKVDMNVEKMLSMTSSELRALSNDDYEIVLAQAGQAAKYGFKFSAFPDYVFIPANTGEDDGNSIVVPVTYSDGSVYDYYLSENVEQLELSGNAEIGSGIKIGMTYTEIEEMLGTKLYMANTESSLGRAAAVDIDGRTWLLHFDLTDEQEEELGQRIAADTVYEEVDGVQVRYEQGKANISDMDPVCDLAIYNIHFFNNMADE